MKNIKGIASISGFGGKYEEACQKMLQTGYEWLEEHKEAKGKLKAQTYENIYGIFEPKSKKAKELSNAIVKAVPDCSGAMHQAVMGHLFFISGNGVDKWKEEVSKKSKCKK